MADATYQDFLDHWGADRTASMIDGDLAKRQSVVGDALSAAGGLIGGAAIAGGFAWPVVVADLSTDADVQAQITALLKLKTIVIATVFFIQPHDDSAKIKATREACTAWLEALKMGAGLPADAPLHSTGLELVTQPNPVTNYTPETLRLGRATHP